MSTVTKTIPYVKQWRSIRLALGSSEVNPFAMVNITVGQQSDEYRLTRVPADFGEGFLLEKITSSKPTAYHANLAEEGSSCECSGSCVTIAANTSKASKPCVRPASCNSVGYFTQHNSRRSCLVGMPAPAFWGDATYVR